MGFRPLDHLVAGYRTFSCMATHRITHQCEISISRRRDIASRPSSLDILNWLLLCLSSACGFSGEPCNSNYRSWVFVWLKLKTITWVIRHGVCTVPFICVACFDRAFSVSRIWVAVHSPLWCSSTEEGMLAAETLRILVIFWPPGESSWSCPTTASMPSVDSTSCNVPRQLTQSNLVWVYSSVDSAAVFIK